jgi:hypothetical protein
MVERLWKPPELDYEKRDPVKDHLIVRLKLNPDQFKEYLKTHPPLVES